MLTPLLLIANSRLQERAVAEARARLERGEPPTDDCERKFEELMRRREETDARREAAMSVLFVALRNPLPPISMLATGCRRLALLIVLYSSAAQQALPGAVKTTAPLRYTAYIPDTPDALQARAAAHLAPSVRPCGMPLFSPMLQIPVPYSGTFPQFRPTEPGSNMRHIRNPEKKPLIL